MLWGRRAGGGLSLPNLACKAPAQIGHVAFTPRLGLPMQGRKGSRVSPGALSRGLVAGDGHTIKRGLSSLLI